MSGRPFGSPGAVDAEHKESIADDAARVKRLVSDVMAFLVRHNPGAVSQIWKPDAALIFVRRLAEDPTRGAEVRVTGRALQARLGRLVTG